MQVESSAAPLLTIDEVEKSPATKDSQFYWTCIPTDFICGFGWQTHPTRKAESLPWAENSLFKTLFHYFTVKLWCTLPHSYVSA